MAFSLLAASLLIFNSIWPAICAGREAITLGKAIGMNQTLTSNAQTFSLGFFAPRNSSSKRYVGIWYSKIPIQTVIWVANRGAPLTDSSAFITVAGDGNLVVVDGNEKVIWSSNLPGAVLSGKKTSAVLDDTGNLVLRDENDAVLWQSFDNPSDTYVPGMKFKLDLKTRESLGLVSWKDANDPSPGEFSVGLDPLSLGQFLMSRGSKRYWRSTLWTGRIFSELTVNGRDYASIFTVVTGKDEMDLMLTLSDSSLITRFVMDPSGEMNQLTWQEGSNSWGIVWNRPRIPCHLYARCGPFGVCNRSNSTECRCLNGFQPRIREEWEKGNWSGGCVRRTSFECKKEDGFLMLEKIKLPDLPTSLGSLNLTDCEFQCLRNCSCTAYSHANISSGVSRVCLIWTGSLMDSEERYGSGQDLYIRLARSELDVSRTKNSHKRKYLVAIVSSAAAIGILISIIFGYFLWRRQYKRRVSGEVIKTSNAQDLALFSYRSILAATDNFSPANKLGEGGFGPVYKGKLPTGEEVAVKRLSQNSGQGFNEFKTEVELIAKLQHTYLVALSGLCIHGDEKILVYEFMPNKSLDKFLFDPIKQTVLNWAKRFHISQGIAQGLLYLHKHSRLKVIHRDLKPGNILLDGALNPKIADFGMARIFGGNQTEGNTNRVVGTYGYMSPEYAMEGLFSEKSDVFSFGVILLELVSGKRSTGLYRFDHSLNLLGFAWLLWREERIFELIDPTIRDSCVADQVSRCIMIGLLCVQEDADDRPDMSTVVFMLGNETAPLPTPKEPEFSMDFSPASTNHSSSYSFMYFSLNDGKIASGGGGESS